MLFLGKTTWQNHVMLNLEPPYEANRARIKCAPWLDAFSLVSDKIDLLWRFSPFVMRRQNYLRKIPSKAGSYWNYFNSQEKYALIFLPLDKYDSSGTTSVAPIVAPKKIKKNLNVLKMILKCSLQFFMIIAFSTGMDTLVISSWCIWYDIEKII